MRIEFYKEPGEIAKELICATFELVPGLETVIVDAHIPFLNGRMGVFVPDTKSVLIDLAACVANPQFSRKGVMMAPAAWFNLVYTVYHEAAHARNFNGLIENVEIHRSVLESAAHKEAMERLYNWLEHNPLPSLEEMGWMGVDLKSLFNTTYCLNQDIAKEVDVLGTQAAARADVFVAMNAFEVSSAECLFDRIDEGEIGLKIGSDRYLTAIETFAD